MFERLKTMIKGLWQKVITEPIPEVLRQDVNIEEWKRIFSIESPKSSVIAMTFLLAL